VHELQLDLAPGRLPELGLEEDLAKPLALGELGGNAVLEQLAQHLDDLAGPVDPLGSARRLRLLGRVVPTPEIADFQTALSRDRSLFEKRLETSRKQLQEASRLAASMEERKGAIERQLTILASEAVAEMCKEG
jgi:hypothetical protein